MLIPFSCAQEINPRCRQMLVDHIVWCGEVLGTSIRTPCIFGDVEGCIPEGVYNKTDSFMAKYRDIENSDLLSHQHCYTHNRYCPIFGPEANSDFETAGLPCVDMSRAGKRLKENGRTASVFITHAKRHCEKRTPVILLENAQARCLSKNIYNIRLSMVHCLNCWFNSCMTWGPHRIPII